MSVDEKTSKMAVREAQRGEYQEIGRVLAAAFVDEEMLGDLMHPHRHEFPGDVIRFFEHKIWLDSLDRKKTILVVTDPESRKIVGVGDWERQGNGGEALDYALLDPRKWR